MKKIFKKNQIIITALALMIAVAGYLQYSGTGINNQTAAQEAGAGLKEDMSDISDEDIYLNEVFTDTEDNGGALAESADTVADAASTTDPVQSADSTQTAASAEEKNNDDIKNPGEAVLTSSSVENLNFAAEVKLNREQLRSKNKETLLGVINNAAISESQKQNAVGAMIQMTDLAEREAAAEMLLEAKGFSDVVVSVTDNSADVVLSMGEVTDAKRAQVEDIVKRKTNVPAENIVITPIQAGAKK